MESSAAQEHRPRRWRRRLLIGAVVLLGGAAVGWQALLHKLDPEQYRAQVAALVEEATGLPLEAGTIHLRLLPSPRLTVENVRLGGGAFSAQAAKLVARTRLGALRAGQVDVQSIEVQGLQVQLPEDNAVLRGQWETLLERLRQRTGGGGGRDVHIAHLSGKDITVSRGGTVLAQGEAAFEDQGAGRDGRHAVALRVSFAAPILGEGARVEGQAKALRGSEGLSGIQGDVALQGVEAQRMHQALPAATLALGGPLQGETAAQISIALTGATSSEIPAFNGGTLQATAEWSDGSVILSGVACELPGLKVQGDLTAGPGKVFAAHVARATAVGDGLQALLLTVPALAARMHAGPEGRVDVVELTIARDGDGAVRVAQGEAAFNDFAVSDASAQPLLAGLRGVVRAVDNQLQVEELTASGVTLRGTIVPDLTARVATVTLTGEADLARLPWTPAGAAGVITAASGRLAIEALQGTFSFDGGMPSGLGGTARLEQVGLTVKPTAGSEPIPLAGIDGRIRLEQDTIFFEEITGEGLQLDGSVRQAADTRAWHADLRGKANLAVLPLGVLPLPEAMKALGGQAEFSRVAGVFGGGAGMRELRVEGTVKEGMAAFETAAYSDRITAANVTFATEENAVTVQAKGTSEALGRVGIDGVLDVAAHTWAGTVSVDADRVSAELLPEGAASKYVGALIGSGASTFQVSAGLPNPEATENTVQLTRTSGPRLTCMLHLLRGPVGWQLADLEVEGAVAAQDLASLAPEGMTGDGTADLAVSQHLEAGTFSAVADLTASTVRWGTLLEKQPGDPARVELSGSAGAEGWDAHLLKVACLGESLTLELGTGGPPAKEFSLDLAKLSKLLPLGSASGNLAGTLRTRPASAELRLEGAALNLGEGAASESVTGGITYREGVWRCSGLAVRGTQMDFTVDAEARAGRWEATLGGAAFDWDAFDRLREAMPKREGGGKGGARSTGTLTIDLGELHARRGTVQAVRAQVTFGPEQTAYDNISLRAGEGTITGSAVQTGEQLALRLDLKAADVKTLEDLLLESPRALRGSVEGTVDIAFPVGTAVPSYKGINGMIQYTARQGTYGRLGFATTLLTVLKTADVLRLSLPSFSDEGLSFTSSTAGLKFREGVMTIEDFELEDKSYSIEAGGTVDFPQDKTDVQFRVYALESVTGLVGNVPIIRGTVNLLKRMAGIRLQASGPPSNLSIRPAGLIGPGQGRAEEAPAETPGAIDPLSQAGVDMLRRLGEGFFGRGRG